MPRRKVAVAGAVAGLAEPPGRVPVEELAGAVAGAGEVPPKRKRRSKAEIQIEKEAQALMAGLPVSVPVPVPVPVTQPQPVKTGMSTGPAELLPYADMALVAELEGVPLFSFVTQAIQFTDQAKQIQQVLDGKKGEDGKTLEGGLRPAINEFLERAGAPGFVFLDESGEKVRAFSFRRVTTERATLDEVLLLQNGVPADVIERSRRKSTSTALTIREIKG